MTEAARKRPLCGNCTLFLVRAAYRRAPLFRLVREPLKAGMIMMSWLHRVDPKAIDVPTESCKGCIRFLKRGLMERSALFRWLHAWTNLRFDRILESIVTTDETAYASLYAAEATQQQ